MKKYKLTDKAHKVCENAQEITLIGWPRIYSGNNPHDLDGSVLLCVFREWAEEFENWWSKNIEDEKWLDSHDYLTEINAFANRKVDEYLKELE